MSINLTERCKEALQAGVGKTCLEFGLWPHLATYFIKCAALGHTQVWGQPGCFHASSTSNTACSPWGLPSILPPAQVSWLSQTQEAGTWAGWITGLISSDKSLVVTSSIGRRLLMGVGKLGGGRISKRSAGEYLLRQHPSLHADDNCAHQPCSWWNCAHKVSRN